MAATILKQSLRLLALSTALALVACGGDDEAEPPKKPDAGSILDPDPEDAGEESDADDEGDGGVDEDAGEAGEETLQASAEEAKKNGWVEGCYKKPTKNEELLNGCAANWRKFDTKLYPASWKEGEALPALP